MTLLKTLLFLTLLAVASAAAFLFSGAYNIAADDPHWPVTVTLIETLRERSIAARSGGIVVPPDLDDAQRVRRGAGNYDAMCTGCHLKPGMTDAEIRKGLYPEPPNLAQAADAHGHQHAQDATARAAARQFRIIKHGVKMTGMPAWSKAGVDDETIWDMVALIHALPRMSADEYAAIVAGSEGHSHAGADGHVDPPGAPPHSHEQKTDTHSHQH